jgi:hypothetical protein
VATGVAAGAAGLRWELNGFDRVVIYGANNIVTTTGGCIFVGQSF